MGSKFSYGLLSVIACLLCSSPVFADLLQLNFEPIMGYEQSRQVLPTQHSSNRLIYGGRITAGILIISLEGEYTHGSNQETYPGFSQTNTGDAAKLGLRSGLSLGPIIRAYLRGGAQASREKNEMTSNGITTTVYQPISVSPYAGLGVRVDLFGKFSMNADVVAVINNWSNLDQNTYQTTAGFSIRLP